MAKLFIGLHQEHLAHQLSNLLGIETVAQEWVRFPDGEIRLHPNKKDPSADQTILLQSLCPPIHDHWMALLLMARQSEVPIAVIPYLPYLRGNQDSLMILLEGLQQAGVQKIIYCAGHVPLQSSLCEEIPFSSFASSLSFLLPHKPTVIISPDAGGAVRAKELSETLDIPWISCQKSRLEKCVVELPDFPYHGADCLIVDDMVDSGETLIQTAHQLKKAGAQSIKAFVVHGLLSGNAVNALEESDLNQVILFDTVPLPKRLYTHSFWRIESAAPLLAKAIPKYIK